MSHHPDEYKGISWQTVYATSRYHGKKRLSFVAVKGKDAAGAAHEWVAQLLLLFRLPDGTPLTYVQFLVADEERARMGPLFGSPGCAPLVWERVGPRKKYSYAITTLETLIRREFIVPDLSTAARPAA